MNYTLGYTSLFLFFCFSFFFFFLGVRGVRATIEENGHDDSSSNPGQSV